MKFVCISDTHSYHRQLKLPEGDVLLHAGDITFRGKEKKIKEFNEWLGEQPFKHKVVVAGNHDWLFQHDPDLAASLITNAVYLNQEVHEIEGIRIYGEPRQPEFCNWAFNETREDMFDVWAKMPENIDILLTHGPPKGLGDGVPVRGGMSFMDPYHSYPPDEVGCVHQRACIYDRDDLKYIVCGHVHEGYGQYELMGTKVINCSVLDGQYKVVNEPIVFEYSR